MNRFLALILSVVFISGCISTNKYRHIVYERYKSTMTKNPALNSSYISIRTDNLVSIDSLIKTVKQKFYFIPAIVFWAWNNTIRCEIDPKTLGAKMGSDILYYADQLKLKEKLNGQSLEISIESIPNSFIYTHNGTVVFVLFYAFSTEQEAIFPLIEDLKVSYKLLDGTTETKKGTMVIADKIEGMNNMWKSTKKFTWLYIDDYNESLKNMSREIVLKLLKVL